MECVVNKTMLRLMDHVLKERPKNAKEVLKVTCDVAKKDLKGLGRGWWCGVCAEPNKEEATSCVFCRVGKNDPIPTDDGLQGSLLVALQLDLKARDQALTAREAAVATKERELGVVPPGGTAGSSKSTAKANMTTPSRFGDGADLNPSQDKVPTIPKLLPQGYLPPKKLAAQDGRAVLRHIGTWYDTKNHKHWQEETINSFVADADFLVEYQGQLGKRGHEAAMCVRTLYAYTHSQLGPSCFWIVYVPEQPNEEEGAHPVPPKYEPLVSTSAELEAAYQSGGAASVDKMPLTGEVKKLLPQVDNATHCDMKLVAEFPKLGIMLYSLPEGHYGVRYRNPHAGDRALSPLRDTVAWLPRPEVLLRDTKKLVTDDPLTTLLPLAGVLEFIAANPAERSTTGGAGGNWHCTIYCDPELEALKADCTAQPNQQKANKKLHERAMHLLSRTGIVKQADFPDVQPDLLQRVVTTAAGMQPGVLMTPEEIARALTLQCLAFNGHHYLLTLSTTTVETRTPHILGSLDSGEVVHMYRSVAAFWPQQIFYLLNMAMRESQFGNKDAELVVQATDLTKSQGTYGTFFAAQPSQIPSEYGVLQRDEPPKFKRKDKGLFGTLHKVSAQWDERTGHWAVEFPSGKVERVPDSDTWVSLKAWMLPQTRPLIFFTNKALASVHRQAATDGKEDTFKTYRGIRCALPRDTYATGNVLVWAQYSSTSEDQGVAAAFAKGDAPAAVFTMHGRDKCVLLSPYSRFAREAELLYMNNTCFRVSESLTTEQAQILGKERLQLFTLQEIEDVDMYGILVRRLLPFAKTTAAASVVFQAEAALRGKKGLELSISNPTDGEVPPKWQAFVTRLSAGCPVDGSTSWNTPNCSEDLIECLHAVHGELAPVGEHEAPNQSLFLKGEKDGRQGTLGLLSVKLISNTLSRAAGTYKRDDEGFMFSIQDDEEDFTISWEEGKWVFEYEDPMDEEPAIFKSVALLGDWPALEKRQGPQIRPSHTKPDNIIAPRCSEGHPLVFSKTSFGQEDCSECSKPVTGAHFVCTRCGYYIDPDCVDVVTYQHGDQKVKFALEENTLVKYVDEEMECPQITKIEFHDGHVVDQRGFQTPFDSEHGLRLARLAALAHVPHNIPLTLEASQSHSDKPVIEAAVGLLGLKDGCEVTAVRVFGEIAGADKMSVRISGTSSAKGSHWVCDVELRRTEARPGLAVGDDGATMAARIIRLGVPLHSIGLRNNLITLDGAKKILVSVKQNSHVHEVTIGDDDRPAGSYDDLEIYKLALSIRCMYHKCRHLDQPLSEDHLSGMGSRWPEIFALALGDVAGLKLPVAGIIDQHPEGWKAMVSRFRHPPEPTELVLHSACRTGRVRAIEPLLDNCGVDPDERDAKGNPALLLAVKQPAFECEQGGLAVKRLVTDPTSRHSWLALRSAVRICGPIVTGALLEVGVVPEEHDVVLESAVVNRLFGSRTSVLQQLITAEALSACKPLLKAAAVKDGCSFSIIETLLDNGGDKDIEEEDDAGNVPLHLVCRNHYSNLGPQDGHYGGSAYCDLLVLRRLITPGTLEKENSFSELPISVTAKNSPYLCEYLLDQGSPIPSDPEHGLYLAVQNPCFNTKSAVGVLKRLFPKEPIEDCAALHYACMKGYDVIVKFLVRDLELDVTAVVEEETPLHAMCRGPVDWGASSKRLELLKEVAGKYSDLDVRGAESMTPLARAIMQSHVHSSKYLLEAGASVAVEIQELPLYFFVAKSEFDASPEGMELVRKVLDSKVASTVTDGYTPLQLAAAFGRVVMTEWLLSVGADPNQGTEEDTEGSPLSLAVRHKAFGERLDVLEKLITPETINSEDVEGSALYYAITKGNLKAIPVLLKHGAAHADKLLAEMCDSNDFDTPEGVELIEMLITPEVMNKKDDDDKSLVWNAVYSGNIQISRLLLSKGCDVLNATDDYKTSNILKEAADESAFNTKDGRGAVQAIVERCPELLNFPEDCPPLISAADNEYLDICDAILVAAAPFKGTLQALNMNAKKNDDGDTFFHAAALVTDFNTHEGLRVLDNAVSLTTDRLGALTAMSDSHTPVMYACEHENYFIAEFFVKVAHDAGGLDGLLRLLSIQDDKGATALHLLASGRVAAPDNLLRQMAVPSLLDAKTKSGRTPLHYAACGGDTSHTETLLSCGADPNQQNEEGDAPLHVAEDANVVALLLAHGAVPTVKNNEGYQPLEAMLVRKKSNYNDQDYAIAGLLMTVAPLENNCSVVEAMVERKMRRALGFGGDDDRSSANSAVTSQALSGALARLHSLQSAHRGDDEEDAEDDDDWLDDFDDDLLDSEDLNALLDDLT